MMRKFYENEETFEAILEQVDRWPGSIVLKANTTSRSQDAPEYEIIEVELLAERLKDLGIRGISAKREDGTYSVFMSFHYEDEIKGYVYLTDPPARAFEEKDLNQLSRDDWGRNYRHIKGNWFLYLWQAEPF